MPTYAIFTLKPTVNFRPPSTQSVWENAELYVTEMLAKTKRLVVSIPEATLRLEPTGKAHKFLGPLLSRCFGDGE